MAKTQVAIIGGGPVGIGLALDLARQGIDVKVFERSRELHQIPKGQNLTQRSGELFRQWNISEQVRTASPIPRAFGNAGLVTYGKLLSEYHYDWFQRSKVGAFYFAENERLPQYLLEQVMRDRLADFPNASFETGCEVTGLDQNDDGVQITYLQDQTHQKLNAHYAVGCDGARSVVRESTGITQAINLQGPKMALLVFRSRELDQLLSHFGGKSIFNIMNPELNGFWQFLGRFDLEGGWFYHAPVADNANTDNTDFKNHLHQMVGKSFDLEFEHIGFWDLRISHATCYRNKRVFIAGDAAHSHPPYGGYGVNTGLEDACNLSWKLAAMLKGWGSDNLLNSYTTERHAVFDSVSRDFIERMIKDFKSFLGTYSPTKDKAAFEAAWEARANADDSDVTEFLPNYAGSTHVWGNTEDTSSAKGRHHTNALPGFHLPPPKTGAEDFWASHVKEGFTLLDLGGNKSRVAEFCAAAEKRGIPLNVLISDDKPVQESYGAQLILLRPDLYVAWTDNNGHIAASDILERVING